MKSLLVKLFKWVLTHPETIAAIADGLNELKKAKAQK